MKIKNIKKAVLALDGVILKETEKTLFAMCRGYDVEVISESFLTIRKTKNRGEYDMGSDYNPGGYIFLNRIKDLNYYLTN